MPFEELAYGEGRSPAIDALLASLGRDRTAVVVYLLERSWQAILAVTALGPLLLWLLGATAVHAAARLRGARAPLQPLLVLLGHAAALVRIPADLVAMALPAIGGLVGTLATLGFGLVAWLALRRHYGFAGGAALATLLIAVVLFYVIPLTVIVIAVVAVVAAAIALEIVP